MPECERLKGCPFFNCTDIEIDPEHVESMKQTYCLGDNSRCARYIVFTELGPGVAPNDLMPDQLEEARELISELS